MNTDLPFAGITVLSIEQAVAAPFATRQLADLGARVIKIERPGHGDFARGYDRSVLGLASYFVWLNRSKESIALDLKEPAAREIVAELLSSADVFVQNLAPGAVERLGFGSEILRSRHTSLIVCNISGYGEDGPWADRKAYDMLVQAETGFIAVTGNRAGPAKSGISIADMAAGMYAYSGILAALFRRSVSGVASVLDISLFDALSEWMSQPAYFAAYSGVQPARIGVEHATICPYAAYRTSTGEEILLAVQNEREWHNLCEVVLGDQSIANDLRFAGNTARVEHRDLVNAMISERLARTSVDDAEDLLNRAGIANGKVNSVRDALDHPVLGLRDRWREVMTESGVIQALLPPGLPTDVEPRMDAVPALGQHTRSILVELGRSDGEIEELVRQGVVGVHK